MAIVEGCKTKPYRYRLAAISGWTILVSWIRRNLKAVSASRQRHLKHVLKVAVLIGSVVAVLGPA